MKIKTAEATGLQLDWGVGKVLQAEKLQLVEGGVIYKPSSGGRQVLRHADPAVCMGLIERHRLNIGHGSNGNTKFFVQPSAVYSERWPSGKTLAQAVARCVIAMRLGDEFEVPDELGVQS